MNLLLNLAMEVAQDCVRHRATEDAKVPVKDVQEVVMEPAMTHVQDVAEVIVLEIAKVIVLEPVVEDVPTFV